jgi:peptide/nickel transport system substrate-binding protein
VADVPYINLFNEVKTSLVRAGWQGMPIQESGYGASYTWFGYYGVTPPK